MGKTNLFSNPLIYVVTVIYIISGFATLSMGNRVGEFVFREDHYFENVGAISFFAASILFFVSFILSVRSSSMAGLKVIKPMIFLGLAVLFFFAAGEEISWGQRILGVQTPEDLMAINQQGETNIHNLEVFDRLSFSFETMFDLLWLAFAVMLPILALFRGGLISQFLPVPHLGIGVLFLFNYLWAKVAKLLYVDSYSFGGIPFGQAVQEVKESNYSLLFAFVALYLMLQLLNVHKSEAQAAQDIRRAVVDEVRKI